MELRLIARPVGMCLCLTLALASISDAGAPPARTIFSAAQTRSAAAHRATRGPRRFATAPCSGTGSNAFIGGGLNNVAAGTESGVLEGDTNVVCDPYSAIASGKSNTVYSMGTSQESFIGGGLMNDMGILSIAAFIGAGENNTVTEQAASVTAGSGNNVSGGNSSIVGGTTNSVASFNAFVGAGEDNSIQAAGFTGGGDFSAIGGGELNDIFAAAFNGGEFDVIGGGLANVLKSDYAFIGAGNSNTITPLNGATFYSGGGDYSFIGGGGQNVVEPVAAGGAQYAVIAGGHSNKVTGLDSTVGGGSSNSAGAEFATVPGGTQNVASGLATFAAGTKSVAANSGAFVWSDHASGATQLRSTASDQFLVRASGGVKLFSNATLTSGVQLAPGSGTWASLSDRAVKTNVVALDDAAILQKVAALPVSEWSYNSEHGVRHIGPMAQDFYAAFGVGEDDRHITTVDEDGIALAAIKGLHRENQELHREIERLEARLARLER